MAPKIDESWLAAYGGAWRLAWNLFKFPWRSCDFLEAKSPESNISQDNQHICLGAFVTGASMLFFC